MFNYPNIHFGLYRCRRNFINNLIEFHDPTDRRLSKFFVHWVRLNRWENFLAKPTETSGDKIIPNYWCLSNGDVDECSWKYISFGPKYLHCLPRLGAIPNTNGKHRLCWFLCVLLSSCLPFSLHSKTTIIDVEGATVNFKLATAFRCTYPIFWWLAWRTRCDSNVRYCKHNRLGFRQISSRAVSSRDQQVLEPRSNLRPCLAL